jgi:hypothetical protein
LGSKAEQPALNSAFCFAPSNVAGIETEQREQVLNLTKPTLSRPIPIH